MPFHTLRTTLTALALSLAALASARPAAAQDELQKNTGTNTNPQTCLLEYQRADNMWAGFGMPTGILGVESISMRAGDSKYFITDWKYEKTRNDGTTYYGSHLRVATNKGQRRVAIQVKTLDITGLISFVRTGTNTYRVTLEPGTVTKFRADLMEVACPS